MVSRRIYRIKYLSPREKKIGQTQKFFQNFSRKWLLLVAFACTTSTLLSIFFGSPKRVSRNSIFLIMSILFIYFVYDNVQGFPAQSTFIGHFHEYFGLVIVMEIDVLPRTFSNITKALQSVAEWANIIIFCNFYVDSIWVRMPRLLVKWQNRRDEKNEHRGICGSFEKRFVTE